MRFTSFKKLSISLVLVSFAVVGAASAQSLVGVNTRLDRTLDSKSAATGQVVTAKLDGTVTTADGTKLPKGTELIGKVGDVKNAKGAASVSLVFTSAKLKDGKEIPVKATVLAAYPELDAVGVTLGDVAVQPAPAQVAGDGVFDQQPGALAHVALSSSVKSHESGTFSST
ncbi:MAG: hypothetical protein WCC27_16905, partial [Acidobacteriaceae bacterium]